MSSAIMQLLNWNRLERRFYLLDTFSGIAPKNASATSDERNTSSVYADSIEDVRQNFSEWPSAQIIVGAVPGTFPRIDTKAIAYLHLDMNTSPPEVAAITALWERLTPGAPVLLDDYAYRGYGDQKLGIDKFAAERNVSVLSLPTGQGLIVKPADRN